MADSQVSRETLDSVDIESIFTPKAIAEAEEILQMYMDGLLTVSDVMVRLVSLAVSEASQVN